MTSTRERQRAAARARLEREMAQRAAAARKRRQLQAAIGGGVALLLVVAGTVWLVASLGDDEQTANQAGTTTCTWTEVPSDQRTETTKDVGLPPTTVKNTGSQIMTIDTNLGQITAKLNLRDVPCTAASFTHLAEQKFFDNTKCHRLVTQGIQVLQCGDPSVKADGDWKESDGTGGPAYRFAEENLPTDKRPPYPAGIIAMANSGPGTNGSQFFIVYGDSQLPASYTVLGTVTKGLDLVAEVGAAGDDGAFSQQAGGGHPKKEVIIKSLTMSEPVG